MCKRHFILYFFSLILSFFMGYSFKTFISHSVTISPVDSDLFNYSRRIDIEGFTLFTNHDNSEYLLVQSFKQDSQNYYRWIVSEEKTNDGNIIASYYGPNCKASTKDPKIGPVSDAVCTVIKKPQNNLSIICQLGISKKGNLFIDRENDGMWDVWLDQTTNIRYKFDKNKFKWEPVTTDD